VDIYSVTRTTIRSQSANILRGYYGFHVFFSPYQHEGESESQAQRNPFTLPGGEFVSNSEPMHRIPETVKLAQTLKEVSMKNNSILNSVVLAKANAKRSGMALLLGFATFSLAVGGMSSTARAQDGTSAPVQGTWLATITRTNQGGANFTAVVSWAAGGVWQATGANDRQDGGVSPLYGSWKRVGENLYSSRAYFFAFDPSGNPAVLLRVDQIQRLKNRNQLEGVGQGYVCSLQGKGQDCVRTPEVDITFTADRVVPPSQ
jgi:hypothetical protein